MLAKVLFEAPASQGGDKLRARGLAQLSVGEYEKAETAGEEGLGEVREWLAQLGPMPQEAP